MLSALKSAVISRNLCFFGPFFSHSPSLSLSLSLNFFCGGPAGAGVFSLFCSSFFFCKASLPTSRRLLSLFSLLCPSLPPLFPPSPLSRPVSPPSLFSFVWYFWLSLFLSLSFFLSLSLSLYISFSFFLVCLPACLLYNAIIPSISVHFAPKAAIFLGLFVHNALKML